MFIQEISKRFLGNLGTVGREECVCCREIVVLERGLDQPKRTLHTIRQIITPVPWDSWYLSPSVLQPLVCLPLNFLWFVKESLGGGNKSRGSANCVSLPYCTTSLSGYYQEGKQITKSAFILVMLLMFSETKREGQRWRERGRRQERSWNKM